MSLIQDLVENCKHTIPFKWFSIQRRNEDYPDVRREAIPDDHYPTLDTPFRYAEIDDHFGHRLMICIGVGYNLKHSFYAIEMKENEIRELLAPLVEDVHYVVGGFVLDDFYQIVQVRAKDKTTIASLKMMLA